LILSMESLIQATRLPSHSARTLVIMAKAPRAGMVKTRLAESISSGAVLELYRCLLADTLGLAKSVANVEVAIMCPEADREELSEFAGDTVRVVAQRGAGLAAGLTSVFRHFTASDRRHVIAFNSDSPHLAPSVLEGAFEMLRTSDIVI